MAVFAWALGGEPGAAGGNFGKPHRDDHYNECHDEGAPSVLTAWMPLVPVRHPPPPAVTPIINGVRCDRSHATFLCDDDIIR